MNDKKNKRKTCALPNAFANPTGGESNAINFYLL